MATLFVDLEAGNDNYAGSSFAVLAEGTNGRISSTTFSSATASFPNDGTLIDQYLSIFNGSIYAVYRITAWVSATSLTIAAISGGTALANQAVDRQFYIGGRWKSLTNGATAVRLVAGDTVRVMGSPAPTSLGINGTWTSGALQATTSVSGATNATPIEITVIAHGYSTGNTVVITGVVGNTAANGTWEITSTGANTFTLDGSAGNGVRTSGGSARLRNNTRVKLASALTANIASTGPRTSAWTASANVTTTLSTTTKEHYQSDSIAIAAGFTTGLAAYWPTGTLDLSGYQQVSFWIQQTTGTVGAAGAVDLRLCSDAAGTTAINTISIPNLTTTGRWMPVTVDLGTALGSSIQSIALYVNTDSGAQTFLLSNIIACKASGDADSLTLTSLIGKNVTGETWWGIQSINGARVMLDADTNATPTSTSVRGYYGTSETVTTWKRETVKIGPALATGTVLHSIQDSGAEGSPITYSAGWDRSAMTTQNLETWLDGQNGHGIALNFNFASWVIAEKFAFARFTQAIDLGNNPNNTASVIAANNCTSGLFTGVITQNQSLRATFNIDFIAASPSTGFRYITNDCTLNLGYGVFGCGDGVTANSNPGRYILRPLYATSPIIANCSSVGLVVMNGIDAKNIKLENNSVRDVSFGSVNVQLSNCLLASTNEAVGNNFGSGQVFSHNHDQTPNNHKIFMDGGLISSVTDQRKTPSGISWKLQPTSTNRSSVWPVTLSLAKIACTANNLVTVKAWMRRTNTALTMRLVCKGGQLTGVSSDVVASMTAAADTWEELTITFTPTEVGVVEITAEAYGGSTHSGWVDDLTITQA